MGFKFKNIFKGVKKAVAPILKSAVGSIPILGPIATGVADALKAGRQPMRTEARKLRHAGERERDVERAAAETMQFSYPNEGADRFNRARIYGEVPQLTPMRRGGGGTRGPRGPFGMPMGRGGAPPRLSQGLTPGGFVQMRQRIASPSIQSLRAQGAGQFVQQGPPPIYGNRLAALFRR